jgi:predicted esterase
MPLPRQSVLDPASPVDRRTFLTTIAAPAVAAAVACNSSKAQSPPEGGSEHLTARPSAPSQSVSPGLQQLGLGTGLRDGLMFVPSTYSPSQPLPLMVLLHGAGGSAQNWFGSYQARAEAAKFILLAPDSRAPTWDLVYDPFSVDVDFIDRALRHVFAHCAVASGKIALAGFSDGASYALSLGLANGDLFDHIVAYSPGFFTDSTRRGKPKLYFTHGVNDTILPIDLTSRQLVPRFRNEGYDVQLVEFDGNHEVPQAVSDGAFNWLKAAYNA